MMKKVKLIAIIGLFVLLLTGARLLWLEFFMPTEQPYAQNGELDLREWDQALNQTITLDGEWEFFPHVWLISGDTQQAVADKNGHLIEVPGGWNALLQPEQETPYG